ncbi:interferon-induced, double-stranded RNA-activated protein kinase-like isoform X2 [Perca fluviatilis]|uniref:interferon-induced, double-stranded RNA-activated protein kinase-like isoform X2 n=1 Tax=Perca fluviatilis TaxID=8168 RepID=UPI0019624DD4|nr:interferon-induced, double-stranded RNA-activated protein kinase-like isoform X2 [Perca fluviatilis]
MMETGNYVAKLHEYAQKTRSALLFEDRSVGPVHDITFIVRAVLDGKAYPDGVGKNKKEARQNAAKNALKCLLETEHQDSVKTTADDNCSSAQLKEELNHNVSDICNKIRRLNLNSQPYGNKQRQREKNTETNFIGFVNHYCQKKRLCHSYIEERRDGPPHNPVFFYKVLINGKEYPLGEGKIVKEAKQKAAQLAWSALQEQSDWDSKVSVRSTVSEDATLPMFSAQSTTLESHESSSQSTSMSTSGSIIFTDSSNPPKAQIPIRSTASEDDAPSELSTSLESLSSSQSMSTGTSGSGIFTDSSNSSEDQHVVKDKNMGKSQNETSIQSRFTSEFDSIESLGSGGFGRVYKARDKLLKKYYAVKIVCCEEKALREVGTLSDLLHRNIVRYYTFWMEASRYQGELSAGSNSSAQSLDNSSAKYLYIQMELCDTKTLKDWIDEKNSQSPQDSKRREQSLSIAQQIVSGVEYIHSMIHIHRDLKSPLQKRRRRGWPDSMEYRIASNTLPLDNCRTQCK